MIRTIDIHLLRPGDHLVGFEKVVKKVKVLNNSSLVEFEDGHTWSVGLEKTVDIYLTEAVNES